MRTDAGFLLSLKELIVALVIGVAVFAAAKPVLQRFCSPADFARRRTVWIVLTVVAFLSPSFWYYAIVAAPLLFWASRSDRNPSALYLLLLQVIPPITVPLPMIGMSRLIDADNYLLLALCVMLPALFRIKAAGGRPFRPRFADLALVGFGVVTSVLYVHTLTPGGQLIPSSTSDDLRRVAEFLLTIVVPYVAISRGIRSHRALAEALSAFVLSCLVMAAIAVFEVGKQWLIYADLPIHWGHAASFTSYIGRGGSIRAMASSGHPLALGYLLVVALGAWLYLRQLVRARWARIGVPVLLAVGLLATYSRGPWLAALFVYLAFAALQPGGSKALLRAVLAATALLLLLYLSPLRSRIYDAIPFLGGQIGAQTFDYRQQLWQEAWQIFMAHPLLGDPAALLKLQDLRQGQGIVDLVNGYLDVLLGSGCLGLSLLLAFIGVLLYRLRAASRRLGAQLRFRTLGASLGACVLATLLLLQDGSFTGAIVPMFFALGALAAAYRTAAEASRVPRSTRVPSKPAAAPLVRPRPARVVGRA